MQKWSIAIKWAAACCWLLLVYMAILMYRERLLMDAGHYVFYVINQQNFRIEHSRIVLLLAQIIPLLLVWMKMPLTVVLIGYSLNHILFPLVICALLYRQTKQVLLWLLFPLTCVMGLHYGWFVPQFELYYAGWLMLAMAVMLFQNVWTLKRTILYCIIMCFVFTAHAMATLVSPFLLIAFLLQPYQNKWRIALLSVLGVVLINSFKQIFITDYEAMASAGAQDRMGQDYWRQWSFISNYFTFILQQYKSALVCTGVLFCWSVVYKKWRLLSAAFLNFFLLSFFIWMLQTGFGEGRYQQQVFFSLLLLLYLWLLAVLFFFKEHIRFTLVMAGALLFCFALSVRKIFINYPLYHSRVQLIQHLCDKAAAHNYRKAIYPNDLFFSQQKSKSDSEFTLPIESLLLSAENGKEKSRSIIADFEWHFENNATQDYRSSVIIKNDVIKPLSWLNPHYFSLDSSTYLPLRP